MVIEELVNLFQPAFPNADLSVKCPTREFACKNKDVCKVDPNKEAIWSPSFGDANTKVMVIAEAPSTAGGCGPHTGGMFVEWKEKVDIVNFVKKYYHTVPHFTDVMKCGVSKQSSVDKSKIFKLREKNCFEKYLIKEIEIINPEVILCLGTTSFYIINKEKENGRINSSIKIFKLVHDSKQANLQLTKKDKVDIIWPIQIEQMEKDKLIGLSYFNKNSGKGEI